MGHSEPFDASLPVPIFPLPNCVLLPGGVLPLHVFEPRYREMTRDVLSSGRQIGMALLKPGYEPKYYTNAAEIYPVVCVGEVLSHEELQDGRYNLLLQGRVRARVRQEDRGGSYRRAHLQAMRGYLPASQLAVAECIRRKLHENLSSEPFAGLHAVKQLTNLFDHDVSMGDLCDLLAHSLIPQSEVEVRQRLLETVDVVARMEHLLSELRTLADLLRASKRRRSWFDQGRDN